MSADRTRRGIAATIALALTLCLPAAAHAARPTERAMLERINDARLELDLERVTSREWLVRSARRHSHRMADEGRLFHNDRVADEVDGHAWSMLGENVGYASDVDSMFEWFMDSGPHRRNILEEDFDRVGIGIVRDEGLIWVTIVLVG